MGQLVFQATLCGQGNLVGPNTASTFNLNVPAVSSTLATLTGTETFTNNTLTSPTLTTPVLGTPSSGTLTNCTGLPNAGLVNSSVTVGSTAISLGGTATTVAGLTSLATNTLTSAASTALTLQSAGTTAVTIDTSQKVGIGTTSPNRLLSLYATQPVFQITNLASGNSQGTIQYQVSGSTDFVLDNQGSGSGGVISFTQAGSERMRIDSGGNIQVRTTTNPNGIKFRVKGGSGDEFELDNDGSQFTSSYLSNNGTIKVSSYWDNTNARYQIVAVSNGVYLASGGVAWIAVSDERKKDIIEPITDAANKVNQLRAVIGKYKTDADGTRRSFLIAQDVQSVFPEAVDATNPDELGVSYSDTIPLLVAAIKEQQATITAQAETINALTARVVALEAK
jgi:hypothetical protein